MKDQLPALTESLPTAMSRPLIPPGIEQRAVIAALSLAGINKSTIAAFTQTHPKKVSPSPSGRALGALAPMVKPHG